MERVNSHVLVVDDDKVNRLFAVQLLQHLGYPVDAVENGVQAVEAVKTGKYQLVLMDCHMPVMDGFEASRIIKTSTPPDRRPAIVAVTANVMPSDRARCMEAGMDDFMAKPIKVPDFIAMLERWLPSDDGQFQTDNASAPSP